MGHTLEENRKWGSWRGWPGKDGIPPYTLSHSLSFARSLARFYLSPPPTPTRCSPAASSFLFHLPALLLILLCRPPLPSDILFRSLTLLSHRVSAPHPTEPTEGARLPSPLVPNPARSAVDTPMRDTPRQGRCAGHNGRCYRDGRGKKREERRIREWPRAREYERLLSARETDRETRSQGRVRERK